MTRTSSRSRRASDSSALRCWPRWPCTKKIRASASAGCSDGEAMVHAGCLAHASLMYYRDAIDVSLADRDWDEALRYADALEAMCRAETAGASRRWSPRARGRWSRWSARGRVPMSLPSSSVWAACCRHASDRMVTRRSTTCWQLAVSAQPEPGRGADQASHRPQREARRWRRLSVDEHLDAVHAGVVGARRDRAQRVALDQLDGRARRDRSRPALVDLRRAAAARVDVMHDVVDDELLRRAVRAASTRASASPHRRTRRAQACSFSVARAVEARRVTPGRHHTLRRRA